MNIGTSQILQQFLHKIDNAAKLENATPQHSNTHKFLNAANFKVPRMGRFIPTFILVFLISEVRFFSTFQIAVLDSPL